VRSEPPDVDLQAAVGGTDERIPIVDMDDAVEVPVGVDDRVVTTAEVVHDDRGVHGRPVAVRVSHYSTTTLSAAASGQRLPTLDVTLAYVRACGGAEAEWTAGWREAAARSGQLPAAEPWQLGGGPPRSDTGGPAGPHRWRIAAVVAVVLIAARATAARC